MLDAVITSLKDDDNCIDNNFLVMSPTGKAVSNTCGSSLHSNKEGLSVLVKTVCKPLQGKLTHCQGKCKGILKLVVIDEHAMMSQQQSHQIDLRSREMMCDGRNFGGCTIVLLGDPEKLPPVGTNSRWIGICQGDDSCGLSSLKEFVVVIKLTENKIIDHADPNWLFLSIFR